MNDRRILIAAEENAILITVEFYEDGDLLKKGRDRVHRYDLDLIVPDDITLNQLLDAVKNGIRRKLMEDFQIDPENMTGNDAYDGIIQRYEEMLQRAQQAYKHKVRVRRSGLRPPGKKERAKWSAANDTEEASEDQQLLRWLIGWKVYHTCRELYEQGYPQRPCSKLRSYFHVKEYPPHPVIACGNVSLKNWENGEFLSLASSSQVWLERERHGEKTLRQLGFLSSSRLIFDPVCCHVGGALFHERQIPAPYEEQFPALRVGWRDGPWERNEEIHIKGSDDVAGFRKMRVFAGGLAGAVSLVLFFAAWAAIDLLVADPVLYRPLLAGVGLCCTGLAVVFYQRFFNRERFRWRSGYEKYVRGVIGDIVQMQREDSQRMEVLYPPVYDPAEHRDLIEQINHIGSIIYSRRPEHSDFLKVRIGTAAEQSRLVPSGIHFAKPEPQKVFSSLRYKNISGTRQRNFSVLLPGETLCQNGPYDGTSGYLDELPADLEHRYSHLKHVPVLMDLKNNSSLGVLYRSRNKSFLPLLSSMILDLCCSHAPEDLQMILFCPAIRGIEAQEQFIRQFRQLPHFQMLLQDISPFVFDREHGQLVLDRLHRISQERKCRNGSSGSHVVMLILEDHGFRNHPLAQLIPQNADALAGNPLGFTFLHFAYFDYQLPAYCSFVLERTEEDQWFYIPGNPRRDQMTGGTSDYRDFALEPDAVYPLDRALGCVDSEDRMYRSFKILSALYHMHLSRGVLPRYYSMIRMLDEYAREQGSKKGLIPAKDGDKFLYYARLTARLRRYLKAQWAGKDSFLFPIGREADRVSVVDLIDPEFGSSVLITGESDEDRSKALTTMLMSIALHNSPENVKLLLVDPVGNGIIRRFAGVPHVARTVEYFGTQSLEQRLLKLLDELKQVRQHRIQEFARLGVSDLREYNRFIRSLPKQGMAQNVSQHSLEPMRRLVLAMNHMEIAAKLLHASGSTLDLQAELMKLMEDAGRYGIHVLLSAEPEEATLPMELLERFQTRVCLKLSSRSASERIIGAMDAASVQMPGNGRAYLHRSRVGGIRQVQIADCDGLLRAWCKLPVRITYMNHRGRYEVFFDSDLVDDFAAQEPDMMTGGGHWDRANGAGSNGSAGNEHQENTESVNSATGQKRTADTVFSRESIRTPDSVINESGQARTADKNDSKKRQRTYDTVNPRFARDKVAGRAADTEAGGHAEMHDTEKFFNAAQKMEEKNQYPERENAAEENGRKNPEPVTVDDRSYEAWEYFGRLMEQYWKSQGKG